MIAGAYGTMSHIALEPGSRCRNSRGRLTGGQWDCDSGLSGACLGPSTRAVAAGPACRLQTSALPLLRVPLLASRASRPHKRGPAAQALFPMLGYQGLEGPVTAALASPPAPFQPDSGQLPEGLWQEARSGGGVLWVLCPLLCESMRKTIFLGALRKPRS